MPAWTRLCGQALRALFAGAGSFVLWSLWLALALLLALGLMTLVHPFLLLPCLLVPLALVSVGYQIQWSAIRSKANGTLCAWPWNASVTRSSSPIVNR